MGAKPKSVIKSEDRIVRYKDLRPCFDAFIDTRTPGSDKKENFTIIGPGVSENPNQYVHIAEPHGFNIGGARQPPGCVNSQHSHDTAEVFFVHSGTWSFDLGEYGDDANIVLNPGDLISIPTKVFRGFKNIGDDIGYLWAVLGKDDPGRVLWAPDVFNMAKEYGLVLLENGSLIDTFKGERVPQGATTMPVTSRADVEALHRFTNADLQDCCVLSSEIVPTQRSGSVTKRALIGSDTKLNWEHGFEVHHVKMGPNSSTSEIKSDVQQVLFVHKGKLNVKVDADIWILTPGDTATIPARAVWQTLNQSDESVEFLHVHGQS